MTEEWRRHDEKGVKIAACVIVRNEEHDFLEWLCFHLAVGFDAILVYDNFSTDRTAAIARSAGIVGDIRVRPWESRRRQLGAYRAAIQGFRREFDWIAFIDSDEYLFAPGHRDLHDFLRLFPDTPAIAAHWLCYGSSGIVDWSDRLVMEQFVHRAPDDFSGNLHIKSIVRPLAVNHPLNAHRFALRDDRPYRDGDGAVIDDWVKPGKAARVRAIDRVRINHYYTRSRAHYLRKLARGANSGRSLLDDFTRMDRNDVPDEAALAYLDATRRLMAQVGHGRRGPRPDTMLTAQALRDPRRWHNMRGQAPAPEG